MNKLKLIISLLIVIFCVSNSNTSISIAIASVLAIINVMLCLINIFNSSDHEN